VDAYAHPPKSIKSDPACFVVMFDVSSFHQEDDLVTFMVPPPVAVERFKKVNAGGTSAVKVTFRSPADAKYALENGIKFGTKFYRCKAYVNAPNVFCSRCKQIGDQHVECDVYCAKCSGKHPTSLCDSNQIKCLRCSGGHILYHCPEIRKRRAEAIKRKQEVLSGKSRRSYKDAVVGEAGMNEAFVQFIVKTVSQVFMRSLRQVLIETQILPEEDYDELEMETLLKEQMEKNFAQQTDVKSLISEFRVGSKVVGNLPSDPSMDGKMDTDTDANMVDHTFSASGKVSVTQDALKKTCPHCFVPYMAKGFATHVKFCAQKHGVGNAGRAGV